MPQEPKSLIIIVDDDKVLSGMVSEVLSREGYEVKTANNLFQGRGLFQKFAPDLVILDRRMPDGDGLELCKELRENPKTTSVPIIFLSSKKSVAEKVVGLTIGADDYLPKPFDLEELIARVKALLRRASPAQPQNAVVKWGDLVMDLEGRKATMKGKQLDLGNKEFDLLEVFLRNPGRVLTRNTLLEGIWGGGHTLGDATRVVDVTISHLRLKLGPLGSRLVSVPNYGYRFDTEA